MNQKHLQEVLNSCPHYDEIINYTPKEDNQISKEIIRYYQDYVFFNWDQMEKIKELDNILSEYVNNREFYNYVGNRFKEFGDVLPLFDELTNLYQDYLNESMKKIENTKWL